MKAAALCMGAGGLELALAEVLDIDLVWYCEYEPPTKKHPNPANAAAKVAAHRFPEVPNHGDLTAVDWESVEPVDLLAFGWPCQPFSLAGKGEGAEDERAIWPDIARGVGLLRPRYLFAENVPSVVVRGELARVLTDLARLGFDAEWACVRASAVGAPHRRERFFLVAANAANVGQERGRVAWPRRSGSPDRRGTTANPEGVGWGEGWAEHAGLVGGSGVAVRGDAPTDTDSAGLEGHRELHPAPGEGEAGALDRGDAPADADGHGCERRTERDGEPVEPGLEAPLRADVDGRVLDWAGYAPAIRRWERILGRRAPSPTVLGRNGGRQLNPVFVEWMQGLPAGWVCDIPGLTRNQKLKVLGNGCVPLQAEAALRHLWPLLETKECAA
jgi:DNA (cytosine-5)-methyltransferase 1